VPIESQRKAKHSGRILCETNLNRKRFGIVGIMLLLLWRRNDTSERDLTARTSSIIMTIGRYNEETIYEIRLMVIGYVAVVAGNRCLCETQ